MDGPASSPRVWVVSELYYPEDTSTGYYLTRIAEALAAAFPTHVLCAQPTYAARGRKAPKCETRGGVAIRRCWGTTWNKDVLPLRLVNVLTITLSVFAQALWRFRRGDRVLVVTNPPLLPFAVALACRLRGARCVLLIHDVYPEVLIATGMLRPDSFPVRLLHRWVSRLYRSVARVVTLGRDMAELASQKLPPGDGRVTVIPNWADCDQVPPSAGDRSNRIRREYGLERRFVVQYSGNMGRTHNLEAVVECARGLRGRAGTQEIHFLLVGSGARKEWLRRTVAAERLDNVTVADRRPREDLPELLTAADVALIPFIPGMAGVSVPSRLYNVLAAGCPVIAVCEPHSELALTVREEAVGWVVHPGDTAAFRQAVLDASENPQRLAEMGRRARRAAETRFSYERIAEAYRGLMRDLDETALPWREETTSRRAA